MTASPANERDTPKSSLRVGSMLMVPDKLSGLRTTPKYNGVSILKTARLETNFCSWAKLRLSSWGYSRTGDRVPY